MYFDKVIKGMQFLVCIVLAFKRSWRTTMKQESSLRKYKVRQMVLMQWEVNTAIKHPVPLDRRSLVYKYSVISRVADDYITQAEIDKIVRIDYMSHSFRNKLFNAVQATRKRLEDEGAKLRRQQGHYPNPNHNY